MSFNKWEFNQEGPDVSSLDAVCDFAGILRQRVDRACRDTLAAAILYVLSLLTIWAVKAGRVPLLLRCLFRVIFRSTTRYRIKNAAVIVLSNEHWISLWVLLRCY